MFDIKTVIAERLRKVAESIRGNIDAEDITASGRTRDSIKVVEYDKGVKIVYDGSGAPMRTTEVGRRPGKVPKGFANIIYQWSIDKGLSFDDEKERKRFAGAVAYGKIKKKGFGRPSPSGFGSISEKIYTPEISDEIEAIRAIVSAEVAQYITNTKK